MCEVVSEGNFTGRNFLLVSSFTLVLQCKSLEGKELIHAILQKCHMQYLYNCGKSADLKVINNCSLCSTGHMLNMYFPADKSSARKIMCKLCIAFYMSLIIKHGSILIMLCHHQ